MKPVPTPFSTRTALRRSRCAGVTLVEAVTSLSILALALTGVLAALMQSRRLTEGSVSQNSALTIVQGFMEQMKNMEMAQLANYDINGNAQLASSFSIPTLADQTTPLPLQTSTAAIPTNFTPGVTPSGVADNLYDFPDNSGLQGTPVSWSSIWPGARTYPSTSAYPGDLRMNLWVWITDLTGATPNATKVYGITIIYTWQYQDGNRIRYVTGSVRSIRSSVPTF
jgi:hypothetical protein